MPGLQSFSIFLPLIKKATSAPRENRDSLASASLSSTIKIVEEQKSWVWALV